MIATLLRGIARGIELADARAEADARRGLVPTSWAPAAAALVDARPELAGVGITDALNAVVCA